MANEGGGGEADVRIRLVVDDKASDAAGNLRNELKQAHEELHHGHDESKGMLGAMVQANVITGAISKGTELVAEGMHQAYEMAERFADAAAEVADETNQQVRQMSGLLMFMDQGQHSLEALRGYAQDTREELEKLGIQAGVATKTMVEMYDRTIERGNRSSNEAKELVEQMALVGKIVPQGMEGLAQGMSMFELGMIRARNPIVQLIAATHVLKGNAHDAAEQLQKMTPEKQMLLAEEAIKKQADLLKKSGGVGPMTLGEVKTGLANVREMFLDAVGQPLLDRLVPQLAALKSYLVAHTEAIVELGNEVGTALGKGVDVIAEAAEGIYHGVEKNWGELSHQFHELFGEWRDAWNEAMGTSQSIEQIFESITKNFVDGFATAARYAKAMAEVFMDVKDFFSGRQVGSTQADVQKAAVTQRADIVGPGSTKELDDAIAKYTTLAKDAATSAIQNAVDPEAAAAELQKTEDAIAAFTQGLREHHEQAEREAEELREKVESQDTGYVGRYIDQAIAVHNDQAQKWAFSIIADSDSMTKALMSGAIQVEGGFEALKKVIDAESPELAKKIAEMVKKSTGVDNIRGHGPSVNFYGANFHIQQNFRDQDPDRVMQVFRRDLQAAVVNRRQARNAVPFGL